MPEGAQGDPARPSGGVKLIRRRSTLGHPVMRLQGTIARGADLAGDFVRHDSSGIIVGDGIASYLAHHEERDTVALQLARGDRRGNDPALTPGAGDSSVQSCAISFQGQRVGMVGAAIATEANARRVRANCFNDEGV